MLNRDGTTPAKLKNLKEVVVPAARKITKTDLAKYLNAWDQKPEIVSLGLQKNFERFMLSLEKDEDDSSLKLPDVANFKLMIAKAILFKKTNSLIRPLFHAFQGNVAIYLISLLANRLGDKIDFDKIWEKQDLSHGLRQQLQIWAVEVNEILHMSSGGKMISEWAKKSECWNAVRNGNYSTPIGYISELR